MKRLIVCVLPCLLLVSRAEAQTVTGVQVTAYRVGSSTPAAAPVTIPLSAFACAPVAAPAPASSNPTDVAYEQTPGSGIWCVHRPALFSLLGFDTSAQYVLDGAFVNTAGVGVAARTAPFTRPGEPPTAAPSGLRVIRSGS